MKVLVKFAIKVLSTNSENGTKMAFIDNVEMTSILTFGHPNLACTLYGMQECYNDQWVDSIANF